MAENECRFNGAECIVHARLIDGDRLLEGHDAALCTEAADALRAKLAVARDAVDLHAHVTQLEARLAETRGLVRDLTTVLEKRNVLLAARDAQVGAMREALIEARKFLPTESQILDYAATNEGCSSSAGVCVRLIEAALSSGGCAEETEHGR